LRAAAALTVLALALSGCGAGSGSGGGGRGGDAVGVLIGAVAVVAAIGAGSGSGGGGSGGDAGGGLIGPVVVAGILALSNLEQIQSGSAGDPTTKSNPIEARRVISGSTQHDAQGFDVYGVVAFPEAPTSATYPRYAMICEAFMQGLSPVDDAATGASNIALTVWPVIQDTTDESIGFRLQEACDNATNLYDASYSREVISSANRSGQSVSGKGPFLIAWSPGGRLPSGAPNLAFLDMSWIEEPDDAAAYMREWRRLVVTSPARWGDVWNSGRFKQFGDRFYAYVGRFLE
jgi:hypothetical protein